MLLDNTEVSTIYVADIFLHSLST